MSEDISNGREAPNDENMEKESALRKEIDRVEQQVKDFAQSAIQAERNRNTDLVLSLLFYLIKLTRIQDLLNLQPKKPDWDLKRDLEKRLEPLNRKTQVAIADIIRKC